MSIGQRLRRGLGPVLEGLLALACYALLVCLVTAPLALGLDSSMLAGKFQWSHAWAMELVHSGFHEHTLWFTNLPASPGEHPLLGLWGEPLTLQTSVLNYPVGGTIVFLGWFNLLVGAALRELFGFLASFNLSVLLVLALAPWAAYLLARAVGAGRFGAAVGGLIFGFNPYVLAVVANGQMAKYNHAWLALMALFTWHLTRSPARWWAVPALWLTATVCLASSPYYFVFAAMLALVLAGDGLRVQQTWKRRAVLAGLLAITAAGVLILDLPLLQYFTHREGSLIKPSIAGSDTSIYELAASLRTLLLPVECTYEGGVTLPDETHVAYLGISTLLLVLLGTWALRGRGTVIWWVVALVFGVLSLGREANLPGSDAVITLPLGYLSATLPQGRALIFVYRAVAVVFLALSVIAALGVGPLLQRLKPRWRRPAGAAVVLLLALDFLWLSPAPFPLPVETIHLPQAYRELPREPRSSGIVEFPCELETLGSLGAGVEAALAKLNQRQIFYQAFHHKGLGMVDKGNDHRPAYQTALLRGMISIVAGGQDPGTRHEQASRQWLQQQGFRRLILHEAQIPAASLPVLKGYLGRVLPRSRAYPADRITAYWL